MKKTSNVILLSVLTLYISSGYIDIQKEKIFEEKKGIVAVEAEHFATQKATSVRKWYLQNTSTSAKIEPDADINHSQSASKKAYLEILPDTRVTHGFCADCVFFTQTHFIDSLINNKSFETDIEYYLKVLKAQEAVYHSSNKKMSVSL